MTDQSNKKYLILAGGSDKWNNTMGMPRHMVPIKGEPLIHRTQRLLLENGATDIVVSCNEGNQDSYVLSTCQYLPSPPCVGNIEEDALAWHYREYLNFNGTTVILYGDCYYSEPLINAIVEDPGTQWHVYARSGGSVTTEKQYSEMFAWVVSKHDLQLLLDCSYKACGMPASLSRGVEQTDYMTYRLMANLDPMYEWPEKIHWIDWNDESDDFDYPRDVRLLEELYNRDLDRWKIIWSNRRLSDSADLIKSLIEANGFDTGYGSYSVDGWKTMVDLFAKQYNINSTTDVLEVGCGSGAFLYQLALITQCNIFGYDYSSSLIAIARKHVKQINFLISEAINNPFQQKFDVVLSHSVFQYFPSVDYGQTVIETMVSAVKPGGKIVLMDIFDSNLQALYHSERSKYFSSESDYRSRYKNLTHTFYSRNEIEKFLLRCGVSNIIFSSHENSDYTNSKYTFSVSGTV